jgi:phosphoribosylanthranilate isomerase
VPEFAAKDHFVKICGITNIDDAEAAIRDGADAIGLILAESKRQITIEAAADLARATAGRVLRVGVFRGNSDSFILDALDKADFDVVQVHGNLSSQLLVDLRSRGTLVVKALSITDDEFLHFDESLVDAVLVDGPSPGSGESHSWAEVTARGFRVPLIAAGGLSPDNVDDVIATVRPWGVDVSTGVEAAPGVKDHVLVSSFIERARRAFSKGELK